MLGEPTTPRTDPGNGAARPDRRALRRAATKAEILDAAWALARTDGLTNFSLRDLATKVGMQAPSLYQYFDSKQAIYNAMFEQGARESLEAVCGVLPATVDPADGRAVLIGIARRLFDFATGDQARMQLLFQRTIPGFEPTPTAYAPAVEMSGTVRRLLTELGFTDPDALDLFSAMVGGLINQQMSNDPGGTRWSRLIERTVDMFIAEMAASGARRAKSNGNTNKTGSRNTKTTKTGSTKTTKRGK